MTRVLVLVFAIITTNLVAQTPVATIPFELYGEHIFIKLKVNNADEELDFIFDTGDGLSVLNLSTAKRLKIRSDKKVQETSAGGRVTGYLVKHNALHLKDAEINNVKLYETSLNHLEIAIGRSIDGIIGYDLLHNYVVEIDYNLMEFHLFKFSDFKYQGEGTPINIKFRHAIPYIPGTIVLNTGDILQGDFYLETGARTDLDFNTPFVNANNLGEKVGDTYTYLVAGLSDHETVHTRGRIHRFSVAGFTFKDLPVGLSQESAGIQSDEKIAGIIGNEILHRFNIVFNYKEKKMWWEENSKFPGPFFVNSSGILLQLNEGLDKILVHQVYAGSVADSAGIKVDDEITSINGRPASNYTLAEAREILASDGGTVDLEIKRAKEIKSIKLQLKELI